MGRLSEILELQGRMEEALSVQEQVCDIASKSLGPRHPETRGHVVDLKLLKRKIRQARGSGNDLETESDSKDPNDEESDDEEMVEELDNELNEANEDANENVTKKTNGGMDKNII